MTLGCFSVANPNPSSLGLPLKRGPLARLSPQASLPLLLRLQSLHNGPEPRRLSLLSSCTSAPNGLCGSALHLVPRRGLTGARFFGSAAASREEPKPADGEVEKEIGELGQQSKESVEAWEQALMTFKEQALKLQSMSQEAYEVYSKKGIIILKETSEKLKIEANKARHDLSVVAKELSEEGRHYIVQAAENSPEPVKDVVETFATSTDNLNDISKVLDFYIGVPYGAILFLSGFLNFMITGSTSGIRFGVILGGALLALSLSSLRLWRKGKPANSVNLMGQTAIAGLLFLRELRLSFQKLSFPGLILTIISGVVAVFFVYRLIFGNGEVEELNLDGEIHS